MEGYEPGKHGHGYSLLFRHTLLEISQIRKALVSDIDIIFQGERKLSVLEHLVCAPIGQPSKVLCVWKQPGVVLSGQTHTRTDRVSG